MTSNETLSNVELARNRFSKVTERFMNYSSELRNDLTNVKPNEMFLTRIDQAGDENGTTLTFEGTLYSSHSSSGELAKSMRRSRAKINLLSLSTNASNEGESIISTAEEHATSQLPAPEFHSIKPKSTSSTVSLAALLHDNQLARASKPFQLPPPPSPFRNSKVEMTFQVDVASTPKKGAQRSSTPKQQGSKRQRSARVKSSSKKLNLEPFSSTLLSLAAVPVKSEHVKQIPPPLLSSSLAEHVARSLAKSSKKRDRSCSCSCSKAQKPSCKDQKIKRIKIAVSTTTKTKRSRSSRRQCETPFKRSSSTSHRHHHHRRRNLFLEQPQFVSTVIEQPKPSFAPLTSSTMKKLKYPVKYFPKAKTVDIDRLNMDMVLPFAECGGVKPSTKNYYQVGDYNIWII